jgi:ATPase subunit of ABC transporter with duplicated ATPase domains
LATHIWRVADDELHAYKGNYEEYLHLRANEQSMTVAGSAGPLVEESDRGDGDRERAREERRLRKAAEKQAEQAAALESGIKRLEEDLARLSADLETASLSGDVAKVQLLGMKYQSTEDELGQMLNAWAELA